MCSVIKKLCIKNNIIYFLESLIIKVGKDLEDHLVQPSTNITHKTKSLSTTSKLSLNTPRDSTTFLGDPFQLLTTLSANKLGNFQLELPLEKFEAIPSCPKSGSLIFIFAIEVQKLFGNLLFFWYRNTKEDRSYAPIPNETTVEEH